MARVAVLIVVALGLAACPVAPSPARAQGRDERTAYRSHRHDATEHYGVGISFLVTGAVAMAVGGRIEARCCEFDWGGFGALVGGGFLASAGMSVLAIAVGLDVGAALWSDAQWRRVGRRDSLAVEQSTIRLSISALYVVGASLLLAGTVPLGFGLSSGDGGLLVGAGVPMGVGYLAILTAIGLDVAAGQWSGNARSVTMGVTPIDGGVLVSAAGVL